MMMMSARHACLYLFALRLLEASIGAPHNPIQFTNEKCHPDSEGKRLEMYPSDAAKYKRCSPLGFYWVLPCAHGTYFSDSQKLCVPPEQLDLIVVDLSPRPPVLYKEKGKTTNENTTVFNVLVSPSETPEVTQMTPAENIPLPKPLFPGHGPPETFPYESNNSTAPPSLPNSVANNKSAIAYLSEIVAQTPYKLLSLLGFDAEKKQRKEEQPTHDEIEAEELIETELLMKNDSLNSSYPCYANGSCHFHPDLSDENYCLNDSYPNLYFQCTPYGRWLERRCPDALVFDGKQCQTLNTPPSTANQETNTIEPFSISLQTEQSMPSNEASPPTTSAPIVDITSLLKSLKPKETEKSMFSGAHASLPFVFGSSSYWPTEKTVADAGDQRIVIPRPPVAPSIPSASNDQQYSADLSRQLSGITSPNNFGVVWPWLSVGERNGWRSSQMPHELYGKALPVVPSNQKTGVRWPQQQNKDPQGFARWIPHALMTFYGNDASKTQQNAQLFLRKGPFFEGTQEQRQEPFYLHAINNAKNTAL